MSHKETFVIESEEDIKRVKQEAVITLSNQEKIIAESIYEYGGIYVIGTTWRNRSFNANLLVLKGATVEQERGRDDRI